MATLPVRSNKHVAHSLPVSDPNPQRLIPLQGYSTTLSNPGSLRYSRSKPVGALGERGGSADERRRLKRTAREHVQAGRIFTLRGARTVDSQFARHRHLQRKLDPSGSCCRPAWPRRLCADSAEPGRRLPARPPLQTRDPRPAVASVADRFDPGHLRRPKLIMSVAPHFAARASRSGSDIHRDEFARNRPGSAPAPAPVRSSPRRPPRPCRSSVAATAHGMQGDGERLHQARRVQKLGPPAADRGCVAARPRIRRRPRSADTLRRRPPALADYRTG